MAKKFLNVGVLIALVILIGLSELTEGATATIAKILTGLVMIYVAINYALWLLKAPVAKPTEETH